MALRALACAAAAMLAIGSTTLAKDQSADKDSLRNPAAEACCGEGAAVAANGAGFPAESYVLNIVPVSEAKPGFDGADWNCKRPDGSRRCFSGLPPSR
jgi:hypothetical protein